MSQSSKTKLNLGLIIGIMGVIAGIVLLFMGNWLIGGFGAFASAGIAFKGYQDMKGGNPQT